VAVLLNITPDHLDRYDGFEAYAASKARLFEMQSPDHYRVIAEDDPHSKKIISALLHGGRNVGIVGQGDVKDQSDLPTLQGPHNAQNVAAAMEVCMHLGVSTEVVAEGLHSYPGLPHRMERIAEKSGVLYVNDSKATNPTAAAPALAAFDKIRWILGGQAKADNLDECAPHFGHVRKAYTIGEAGEMFASLLSPHMAVAECVTLDSAVKAAAGEAEQGDTVLLSPACASFDQFRDYEARGDAFRAAVGEL